MACKDYCVYKHTLPNNKVYIGITKQIPSLRWANGRGYKHSNYFYNAILKYGWLNIRHEILRDCLTIEEAIDRLNKLIPMEILMPLGGAGFVGNELNKE